MTWRTFFRLVQSRRIIAPLAALLAGKGIDHQVRRADHALLDRCRGLQRQQFIEHGLIETTAELGQELGQHQMFLGPVHLSLRNATRIHHRQVGAQLAADLFIRTVQFMLE
jgi:hypothetical protein